MRRPSLSYAVISAGILALAAAVGGAAAKDYREHGAVGRLFISPMGEPFRSDLRGDPEAAWFAQVDADHDGRISLAEFQADAERWFTVIDRNHDGEIDPDDIGYYEDSLVPEIRVADAARGDAQPARSSPASRGRAGRGGMNGRGGGGVEGARHGSGRPGGADQSDRPAVERGTRRGAARYSYLDTPEPLTSADANMNRGVDKGEMTRAAAERFATLDKNGDGYLEHRELPRVDTRTSGAGPRPVGPRPGSPPPDRDRQLGGGDRE